VVANQPRRSWLLAKEPKGETQDGSLVERTKHGMSNRKGNGPGAIDRDYWLHRSEGFRVDSPDGRVGFVKELRFGSSMDRPDALAVRAGLFGRLLLIVPVEQVKAILPQERRIVLRASPRPTAIERLRALRGRGGREG